jgi:hypothetical protein
MVSTARAAIWIPLLFTCSRYMVHGYNIGGTGIACTLSRWRYRCGSAQEDVPRHGYTDRGGLARKYCGIGTVSQLISRVINNYPIITSSATSPRPSGGNMYPPSARTAKISRESCSNSTLRQDSPLDKLYIIVSLHRYLAQHPLSSSLNLLLSWRLEPSHRTKRKASHYSRSRDQQRNEKQNLHANWTRRRKKWPEGCFIDRIHRCTDTFM